MAEMAQSVNIISGSQQRQGKQPLQTRCSIQLTVELSDESAWNQDGQQSNLSCNVINESVITDQHQFNCWKNETFYSCNSSLNNDKKKFIIWQQ
jgi:hypothetical protein